MKYIDINTSHNISIRYELASTFHRIFAWIIDIVIMGIYAGIVSIFTFGVEILLYILIFLVLSFYHLIFELIWNGQSPGKKLVKIKVVTLHGRTPKPQDYFLRWIFRIAEITFTGGLLAILYISSTEKNQRIGDLLAQTTVIKLNPDKSYHLDTLLKLNKSDRKITYPQASMYSDTDMMLLKDVLQRIRNNPNDNNRDFLVKMATRISEDLGIELGRKNRAKFLETVLLDYISLTR